MENGIKNKILKHLGLGGSVDSLIIGEKIDEFISKIDENTTKNSSVIGDKIDNINKNLSILSDNVSKISFPEQKTKIEVTNFPKIPTPVVNIPETKIEIPKSFDINEPNWLKISSFKELISKYFDKIIKNTFKVELTNQIDKKTQDVVVVDREGNLINFQPIVNVPEIKIPPISFPMSGGGGGGINQEQLKNTVLTTQSNAMAIVIDEASTANITYVGKAPIGSSQSSAGWQIMKMDESGTPTTLAITWADGNANYDNVWDNRTSLTYL